MTREMTMNALQNVSVKQLVAQIQLHQNIQKHIGPKHKDYERHGAAIRAMCAEMAKRVKADDELSARA